MSDIYEAISVPARRAILDELHQRDRQTLFEITARLAMKHNLTMSRQAISQHLVVLEAVGLISTEKSGRYKYHTLHTEPLQEIVRRWLSPRENPLS